MRRLSGSSRFSGRLFGESFQGGAPARSVLCREDKPRRWPGVQSRVMSVQSHPRLAAPTLLLIGLCSLVYFLDGLIHSILGPLAPEMSRSLQLTLGELGPIFYRESRWPVHWPGRVPALRGTHRTACNRAGFRDRLRSGSKRLRALA